MHPFFICTETRTGLRVTRENLVVDDADFVPANRHAGYHRVDVIKHDLLHQGVTPLWKPVQAVRVLRGVERNKLRIRLPVTRPSWFIQ